MATYFLRSKHISRGKGSLATRAAAYRAGERIKDERTGQIFDYSDRQDVAYKEVVVPSDHEPRPGADSRNHHAHLLMTSSPAH